MSVSFTGIELMNIAIDIEKTGIAFYDIMTTSTESEEARTAFRYLAAMERHHVQIFQDMLGAADKYQIADTRTEEYRDYLQALVDSAVFTDDFISGEMASRVGSDVEALEMAINAEKDSILCYYQMKEIMPQRAQTMVDKVIKEEKSHLSQLSELKKTLETV